MICSEILVKSAELNFEVSKPQKVKPRQGPHFSQERTAAHALNKKAEKNWRIAGRPKNKDNIFNID